MTHKEFHLLMEAEQEKMYDRFDLMATGAMMTRAAYHAKKLKITDLFDRKKAGQKQESPEDMKEKIRKQQEWIDRLNIGKGGEHGRENAGVDRGEDR